MRVWLLIVFSNEQCLQTSMLCLLSSTYCGFVVGIKFLPFNYDRRILRMDICLIYPCHFVGCDIYRPGWSREISQNYCVWNDRSCTRLQYADGKNCKIRLVLSCLFCPPGSDSFRSGLMFYSRCLKKNFFCSVGDL